MMKLDTFCLYTRGCGRWGAARYGAVLAAEYGQMEGTAVAMATRAPGARRQGILTPPAKYQVDQTTGSEVMGIFCKQRN